MNTINRDNYEVFMVDYLDGNLSAESTAELLLFLEKNADLKAELEAFKDAQQIIQSTTKVANKEEIINHTLLSDESLVALLEGDLTTQEATETHTILQQHIEAQKRYVALQHTVLKPDTSIAYTAKQQLKQVFVVADTTIVFANKTALKRKPARIIPLFYQWAAAASILLLLGIVWLNTTKKIKPSNTVAYKANTDGLNTYTKKTKASEQNLVSLVAKIAASSTNIKHKTKRTTPKRANKTHSVKSIVSVSPNLLASNETKTTPLTNNKTEQAVQSTIMEEPVQLKTIKATDYINNNDDLALTTIKAGTVTKEKKDDGFITLPKIAKRMYDNLTKDKIQISNTNGLAVETKLFAFSSR